MKLAFYRAIAGGLLDWLIAMRHWGKYSHVELVFSDGLSFSSSIRDGGVRFKRIEYKPDRWDFLDLPITAPEEYIVRRWAEDQLGKGYDKPGILAYINPLRKQDPNRYYCSEICCEALQQIGWFRDVDPAWVWPTKLFELALLALRVYLAR
jgi:hypothetical protein